MDELEMHDAPPAPPLAEPAPAAPKKTAEEWMALKRHVRSSQVGKLPPVVKPSIEFACAKALHGWPEGKELTEAEYDDAVRAAMSVEVR